MSQLGLLPSVRKQQLFSEFTGLKQACPEGIFVTLTPGDPTLWSAVLFVREGPYASAVLRFQICFPEVYPTLPPIILFATDIFHPLISPLTTYTYTTDMQDSGTVSASDQERLPPGGFSLRHGFPDWFGRGRRLVTGDGSGRESMFPGDTATVLPGSSTATPESSGASTESYLQAGIPSISVYSILKYIKSTFDSGQVLDSVPLAAAGNPGAWQAWRTYRHEQGKTTDEPCNLEQRTDPVDDQLSALVQDTAGDFATDQTARHPGEWNWDGVWEDRVKNGIAASLSEAVLYGGSGAPDEMIRFLPMEEPDIESVKNDLRCAIDRGS